ncbi:AmpG permease [Altererythrobacter epoxidivorans]|uniref:AmpG permease n=1 Tax=Altererythrobacter epoxidivorans TaxID=361183 RepID=A0A0M4MTA6_9SPHN|nr:MFS transporter [Altererythrobacter epoxidivorans]ALE15325.1 AmpG permease [Altererythrobacter epoxidivorans]
MTETAAQQRMVLSESKPLRLFSFFLLYFGQGLPLGVSMVAFPAWLVANGASEADVAAIIATTFLPWSFKFIPAAVMDRYAFLAMGRRRLWLIVAQMLMVLGFTIAAVVAPQPDDLQVILYVIFLIGAGSAIQDVAVDGLAVDILPEEEQGTASSFMFGGQAVGRAASAVIGGFGLQYFGSQATFLFFLPIILLITIYVVFLRERPGERLLPWTEGKASQINLQKHVGAWWPMAVAAFRSLLKFDSLKLIFASSLARGTAGFFDTMWPIIAVSVVGYTTASYSSMISTVDLVMAVLAIGVGSFLTARLGPRNASFVVWIYFAVLALLVLYGRSIWIVPAAFIGLSCLWSLAVVMTSIATNPLRMQLSDPSVAATQFTIYNSLSNLPVSIGATVFAMLGGTNEMATVMWLAAGLMTVAAFVFLTLKVGDRVRKADLAAEPEPRMD